MKPIIMSFDGDGFLMPLDAVTQAIAYLGRRGSGKSYGAGRFIEQLAKAGAQFFVVDPIGIHYGLRLAANGSDPGIPVYVFGGLHADVPLESTAGAVIAETIVDSGISAVLDVSDMTGGEQRRFVTDFATSLLHLKKRKRSPIMGVWDESQEFCPQHVFRDAAKMVVAMERLIKLGRNFGIGTTLISQRPQAVNKDVLNQTECLFVFQLTGPQEVKTIEGWINEKGLAGNTKLAEAVEDLASLPRGTAFVWSPQWLRVFTKVKIAPKWTFDASSTPEAGKMIEAKALAPVDLEKLGAKIKETVERAKANDPAELKREVAELRRKLATAAPQIKEVSVLTDDDRRLLEAIGNQVNACKTGLADYQSVLESLIQRTMPAFEKLKTPIEPTLKSFLVEHEHDPRFKVHEIQLRQPRDDYAPTGGLRRMLVALMQRPGLNAKQLGVRAGLSSSSGTFNTYLQEARTKKWIEGDRHRMTLTSIGRNQVQDAKPLPEGRALLEYWMNELGGGPARMLEALAHRYPATMTKEELGLAAGLAHTSGTFNTYLSKLRTLELVSGSSELRATEDFFT